MVLVRVTRKMFRASATLPLGGTVQHHYNLTNALQLLFSGEAYWMVDV